MSLMRQTTIGEEMNMKICLVGEKASGKSTLVQRLASREFRDNLQVSVNNDFSKRNLRVGNYDVSMQIWDILAEEKFLQLTSLFTRGSDGFMLLCEANDPHFFAHALKWKKILEQSYGLGAEESLHCPIFLVVSKADILQNSSISGDHDFEKIKEFAKSQKFSEVICLSAKTGVNTEQCLKAMAQQILSRKINRPDSPLKKPRASRLIGSKQERPKRKCFG